MNWLADKARESGKELLLLNLDETSIPVTFTHTGGNVMRLDPTKKFTQITHAHHLRANTLKSKGL